MITGKTIKAAVSAGVAAQEPNLWPRFDNGESLDRRNYVTASEIGKCARQVFFEKQAMRAGKYSPDEGTTKPAKGYGFFERGHTIEAWFVENLARGLKASVPLMFAGKYQRSFVRGKQSGTPDGAFYLGSERFQTLEVKSIDPRKKVSTLPQLEHVWQCTQNADLLEHSLNRVCAGSLLVYINASDYEDINTFELSFDHALADKLEKRAVMIMAATSAEQLEPEGVAKNACGFCKHTAACNDVVRSKITPVARGDIADAAARLFSR